MTRTSLWPLFVLIITGGISLWFTAAQAQLACGDRKLMVEVLSTSYGEIRKGAGLSGRALFEVWASDVTGGWTILRTFPNGRACIVALGQNWQADPVVVETGT